MTILIIFFVYITLHKIKVNNLLRLPVRNAIHIILALRAMTVTIASALNANM